MVQKTPHTMLRYSSSLVQQPGRAQHASASNSFSPLCPCHTIPEPRPRTKHTAEQHWGKLGGAWQPQTNEKWRLQFSLLKQNVVVLIDVICHLPNNSLFFRFWPTLWSNFIIPAGKSSCVLEHGNWYKLVIYWLTSQHVLKSQPELL